MTEADAKKIYDEKIGQVKPEQEVHARHILVATEDEAKEIAERLKKGEDFATLAKEKSKDPDAEGGDLGFFARGQMLKPFEDAAFALEVGQISEPGADASSAGTSSRSRRSATSRCRASIRSRMGSSPSWCRSRRKKWSALRKAAKIEVVDPKLKKAMEDEKAMDGQCRRRFGVAAPDDIFRGRAGGRTSLRTAPDRP